MRGSHKNLLTKLHTKHSKIFLRCSTYSNLCQTREVYKVWRNKRQHCAYVPRMVEEVLFFVLQTAAACSGIEFLATSGVYYSRGVQFNFRDLIFTSWKSSLECYAFSMRAVCRWGRMCTEISAEKLLTCLLTLNVSTFQAGCIKNCTTAQSINAETQYSIYTRPRSNVVGWSTMLQVDRSRVQFPMRSLNFSIYLIVPAVQRPTLQLTVSQSLCRGIEPILGLVTRYYFLSEGSFLKVAVLSFWGALSDERSGLSFVKVKYIFTFFVLYTYQTCTYIIYKASFSPCLYNRLCPVIYK
jgi:hypothetical protein